MSRRRANVRKTTVSETNRNNIHNIRNQKTVQKQKKSQTDLPISLLVLL